MAVTGLGVSKGPSSWWGRHRAPVLHIILPGQGLREVPVPSVLWVQPGPDRAPWCRGDSGMSPWQRWSSGRRARRRALTIFTFPEAAPCSSNLPQLGSLRRREAAVTAAPVGPAAPPGLPWPAAAPRPCPGSVPVPIPISVPRLSMTPELRCPRPLGPAALLPTGEADPRQRCQRLAAPSAWPRPLHRLSSLPQPLGAGSQLGRGRQQVPK